MKPRALAFAGLRSASPSLVVPQRAASAARRLPSFDYLKVFVIALVVLQHAAMAYCTGGELPHGGSYTNGSAPVVEPGAGWAGFNLIVSWTNGFFMPLMFLLSGLFVRRSLERKGLGPYLVDRALRLGVPLLAGILTIIPLAYYAAYLQGDGHAPFGRFWLHMVGEGPWPSGPLWFVGVLLVFDAVLALLLSHDGGERGVRILTRWLDRHPPGLWFAGFIALSLLVYLPLRLAFGASLWLTAGPLGIQACRIGLYFFFFAAGAIVGGERLAAAFDRDWLRWPLIAALANVPFLALQGADLPELVDGTVLVMFSTTMALGLLALAVRFGGRRTTVGDSLGANAYGTYLLHWPIVLWLQYALLEASLGPIAKGVLVLAFGFTLAWLASSALRRLPGVARVV